MTIKNFITLLKKFSILDDTELIMGFDEGDFKVGGLYYNQQKKELILTIGDSCYEFCYYKDSYCLYNTDFDERKGSYDIDTLKTEQFITLNEDRKIINLSF